MINTTAPRIPVIPSETEGIIFQSYVTSETIMFEIISETADSMKISENPIVNITDADLLN